MNFFANILLAISFLSRIPIKLPEKLYQKADLKKSAVFFPLVGYLPGLIIFLMLSIGNSILNRFLALAISFWLFDLFHFDGLLDTFDGFLNQSTREKRLEIMSKGNVGPFAVFFGTLFVLAIWELMKTLKPSCFLLGSVFGRWAINIMICTSKPAKETGLGKLFFPSSPLTILYSFSFVLPLLYLGVKSFIISLAVTILVSFALKKIAYAKIGGITGDVLGATHLIVYLSILLSISLLQIG